ncbi:MAG: LacI family transcriptional regulator [Bifidobacteriaceae bacterium]|nr:LacI family transcriptional regulator [Bifidobacteriaceae bacterium]
MTGSRITLEAVARRAGVSVATSSKVLNGRSGVAPETRERVRQAMVELGYRPTTARADLPGSAVERVVVIFDQVDANMYSPELLQDLLNSAAALGVEMMLRILAPPKAGVAAARVDDWARSLLGGGCQGALFVTCELEPAQIQACARIELPMVAIDSQTMMTAGMVTISASNFTGGRSQAQYLIDLGHKRIGVIAGPKGKVFAAERAHGAVSAILDAGLGDPITLLRQGHFAYESGLELGGELLDLPNRPTAIVANSDVCAWGVMEAARLRNVRVPQDLSVVGFDGTKLAAWSVPRLTTVVQPLEEIARLAITTIKAMIEGRDPNTSRIQLPTQLQVGGTTAPPPGAAPGKTPGDVQ